MTAPPRTLIEQLEAAPSLPEGADERFNGFGVMGLPFRSGHVLAMRRFPATSIGPGYTSVWHRDPDEDWRFYATVPPRQACSRYFGAAAVAGVQTAIDLAWTGPDRFRVSVPGIPLTWEIRVGATVATRLMNAAARTLPESAWRNPRVLAAMGAMAGPLLGAGRVGLQGNVPNGQRFVANPRLVWAVTDSRAVLAGEDLGPPGPVRPQARLGDFWIPQRGLLAIGQATFEPFDPARHSGSTG